MKEQSIGVGAKREPQSNSPKGTPISEPVKTKCSLHSKSIRATIKFQSNQQKATSVIPRLLSSGRLREVLEARKGTHPVLVKRL